MWIVTGVFDLVDPNANTQKSKLLKPGKTYNIGRKATDDDTQLVINKTTVSKSHAAVVVGPHTVNDVTNADSIPTLQFAHKASKSKTHLIRNGEIAEANISVERGFVRIQSGDQLKLAGVQKGQTITFTWQPLNPLFLHLPKPQRDPTLQRAAPLSFKFTRSFTTSITHLIASKLDLSVEKLYSSLMAGAQIVNEGWWDDACGRAEAPKGLQRAWEETYPGLEAWDAWMPELADGLTAEELKPDERRKKLFEGLTFVLLDDASPSTDLTVQLQLGGAHVESIDLVSSHTTSAGSVLPRLKTLQAAAKKRLAGSERLQKESVQSGLCVVLGKNLVKDVLGRTWANYEKIVQSLGLSILTLDQVHQSILNVSANPILGTPPTIPVSGSQAVSSDNPPSSDGPSAIEPSPPVSKHVSTSHGVPKAGGKTNSAEKVAGPSTDGSLPDEVQGTFSESPIVPPEPTASQQPVPHVVKIARRRGAKTLMDAIMDDDEDMMDANVPTKATTPPPTAPPRKSAPPTTTRSTRKRTRITLDDIFAEDADPAAEEEPAYKKYKRELEEEEQQEDYKKETARAAAVVDAVWRQSKGERVEIPGLSQAEMEAARQRRKVATASLETVDEDEVMESLPPQTGKKRKSGMDSDEVDADDAGPAKKRQTRAASVESDRATARAPARSKPVSRSTKPLAPSSQASQVIAAATKPTSRSKKSSAPATAPNGTTQKADTKGLDGAEIQMDTDPKFLQALASRKRGKKKEDEFDRDFNALRIAAPAAESRAPDLDDEYRLLEDMDFSGPPPVGNFMRVIQTNEIFRKDRDISKPMFRNRGPYDENGNWAGKAPWDDPKWALRPNYKAFVTNNRRPKERTVVPTVCKPLANFGLGPSYWKEDERDRPRSDQQSRKGTRDPSQDVDRDFGAMRIADDPPPPVRRMTAKDNGIRETEEDQDDFGAIRDATDAPHTVTKGKGRAATQQDDDDEEAEPQVVRPASKRGGTVSKPTPASKATARKVAKGKGKVIESESEEDDEDEDAMEVDEPPQSRRRAPKDSYETGSTLKSSGRAGRPTPARSAKKTQDYVVMDDSDDDMRAKVTRRR